MVFLLKIKRLKMTKKAIVLIHGLLANGVTMKYLEKDMKNAGYDVYIFNYNSINYSSNTISQLHALLNAIKNEQIFLVGHSMGGLIARNYVHSNHLKDINKIKGIITIATPHNQSLAAHAVSKSIFGKFFGTAGMSGLTKQMPEWNIDIPIGCIAGHSTSKLSLNLFILLTKKKGSHDGTVFIDEAILEKCSDSIVIQASHTGLLFKKEVSSQCLYFLENNKFLKEEKAAYNNKINFPN